MVELVVANVDVFAAVVPQGEAEPLAAAAQTGFDQSLIVDAADARFRFFEHPHAHQGGEGDAQLLLIGFAAEP